MSPVPVVSGRNWEMLPGSHPLEGVGISPKHWLRDSDERSVEAIFKYPADPADRNELYSLGFERVAYRLGEVIGVPVPDTHLERFDGKNGAVQVLHPNAAWSCHWERAAAMGMWGDIVNRDLWPLCVAFDLWLANVDRYHRNLVFEAIPTGRKPMLAGSCKTWLPDHGYAGLYPPIKFSAHDIEAITFDRQGRMSQHANGVLRDRMPVEYRESFTALAPRDARRVLDRIRAVADYAIDSAVNDVPRRYFTPVARRLTVELLKARRDAVDTLAAETF